jgi:MerR family transcriptional regulator/heat shock protein HspR
MATRSTAASFGPDDDGPVYVISVAAQLAGMHAQTLRQYDRLGLVSPSRTRGGGRRYSGRDVALLREVQRLSQEEGVSLAGIQRILELEHQVAALRARVAELAREVDRATSRAASGPRVFAAGTRGEIVTVRPGERPPRQLPFSQALVLWRPTR